MKAPVQLALVPLAPPAPPDGAPVVECVLLRGRTRVRVVSGCDTDGAPAVPGSFCRFDKGKRHAGARFAVGGLTRIEKKFTTYYATRKPLWLLSPGGTP